MSKLAFLGTGGGRLPSKTISFPNGLTVLRGAVGSGKTMLIEALYWALSGKIKGARKASSFGGKPSVTVGLVGEENELVVNRVGSSVSVLGTKIEKTGPVAAAVSAFCGIPTDQIRSRTYCPGFELLALLTGKTAFDKMIIDAAGLVGVEQTRLKLVAATNEAIRDSDNMARRLASKTEGVDELIYEASVRVGKTREVLMSLEHLDLATRYAKSGSKEHLESDLEQVKQAKALFDPIDLDLGTMVPSMSYFPAARFYRDKAGESVSAVLKKHAALADLLNTALPEEVKSLLVASASNPAFIDARLTEIEKQLKSGNVVTNAELHWAKEYLQYANDLTNIIANLEYKKAELERQKEQATQTDDDAERARVLQARASTLNTISSYLDPQQSTSVRQRIISQVTAFIVEKAGCAFNRVMPGSTLLYTEEDGILLQKPDCTVPVSETSCGEMTLASVCLRVGSAYIPPAVPFLAFDDVTGPLGPKAPAMAEMLSEEGIKQGIPIVLITHDPAVAGDSLCVL